MSAKKPETGKTKKLGRVSSGIPGFDSMVSGGFKEGSVNLIAGEPGSGKTIFAIQYLLEGCKKGEPGIYVTFEEKKDKLYEDMRSSFGWKLGEYEKKGLFRYLEYTPEQVKKVLVEGGGVIDSIVQKIHAKRMVIDSITSFALLYEDELTKKEAALALFDLIAKFGCTSVMTSQMKTGAQEAVDTSLQFEVDSIVILYHGKKKGERIRALEVLKMRGTKIPSSTFGIVIDKRGLSVTKYKIK